MGLILLIVVIVLIFGGGGGYYAHSRYGGAGLGGVFGTVLVVLLVSQLKESSAAARGPTKRYTNLTKVPKPTNITCYECADENIQKQGNRQPCRKFRDLWTKFVRAKKAHTPKSQYRDEILVRLKQEFGRKCQYGIEDCYLTRPVDRRITGYEQRGCGSGPLSIDAEPGEGCTTEKQKKQGEKMEIINCVCDEKTNEYKGYCNKAGALGKGWGTPLILLGALHLLLAVINVN